MVEEVATLWRASGSFIRRDYERSLSKDRVRRLRGCSKISKRHVVCLVLSALFLLAFFTGYFLIMSGLYSPSFSVREYTQVGVGLSFCVLAIIVLAACLGVFLVDSDRQASKFLDWLRKWRP